jgi:hypothetical protein
MPYLAFSPGARYYRFFLPQWQRERVAEAVVRLLENPRPQEARLLSSSAPEAYEARAGDRRFVYRIYKDTEGNDLLIVVVRS